MDKIKLIVPEPSHKKQAHVYVREYFDHGEYSINGDGGLDCANSYEEWLNKIKDDLDEKTAEDNVPTSTYFAIRQNDNKIIGTLRIRHILDDYFFNYGGHIGYGVSPLERRKGYATEMLKQALEWCKILGINHVLVTCDKTNIASASTILKCGGILENEIKKGDRHVIQRYWINI